MLKFTMARQMDRQIVRDRYTERDIYRDRQID